MAAYAALAKCFRSAGRDIDWAAGRIVVQSPKTEHHPGKETRAIPLFSELRPILAESFDLAPEGAVYVVDERMRASAQCNAGWRNCNLRTTFTKIVGRAGLTAWPRLFHNLRSSRQTELAERFPSHVVCDWLGNSEDIARKHYYQTTDEHFARAGSDATDATQNPKQQLPAPPAVNSGPAKEMDRSKAKQNPKQLAAVLTSGDSQHESPTHDSAGGNNTPRNPAKAKTDGEGFEPTVDFHPRRFSRPVP